MIASRSKSKEEIGANDPNNRDLANFQQPNLELIEPECKIAASLRRRRR